MPQTRLLPGFALVSAGAITLSTKATIVKLAYRYGVDAVAVIVLRMLFALLVRGHERRLKGNNVALGALLVFVGMVAYAVDLV